jgi:hypothetical protein
VIRSFEYDVITVEVADVACAPSGRGRDHRLRPARRRETVGVPVPDPHPVHSCAMKAPTEIELLDPAGPARPAA